MRIRKFNESLDIDEILIKLEDYKKNSDDMDTPTTCLITRGDNILVQGTNCLPGKTQKGTARQTRPLKYAYLQHAERDCESC